jgi:hypothetical protein
MQPRNPVDVVQAQLDAYNARDLRAFLDVFHEQAEIGELGRPPAAAGKSAIAMRYEELFTSSPDLHSHLVSRTVFERAVVDLEDVSGRNGSTAVYRVLAIYEVEAGLIRRVHFVRPQD